MTEPIPTRQNAWDLLNQYTQKPALIKHALAVEAAMRYFAARVGEEPEKWGVIGLVHDLDYDQFPDQHCQKTREILTENRWPDEYIRAVLSHGWKICTDVEPQTELEKTLFTIDELTGLITAAVLVRPSKSILDLTVKSVKKKWKDRRFAAGVNRDIIEQGCQMLNRPLDDIIADTLKAMQSAADSLGLRGNL